MQFWEDSFPERAFFFSGLYFYMQLTHILPLQDINRGMEMLRKGEGNPVRIVITFD